ncbi:MAG TPA: hypothetical protein VHA14_00060, partial [Bryobacteraceae bacterium]|nr:hypothetical protein [Bryobacteraceae bacterium]
MRRVLTMLLLAAAALPAATEREVAEWALRWEGTVTIEGASAPISNLDQIPAGDFHISAIELTGGVMHPIELTRLAGLTHLRDLYLPGPVWNPGGGNEAKTGVFQALSTLTNVERVGFGWHYNARIEVGDKDFAQLNTWTNLRQLRCSQCSISKLDLSTVFPKLEDLDLSFNPFTDEGMAGLANLKNLRVLMLRDTLVTDDGLKYLKDLTNLEVLDLSGTKVSNKGIEYLRNLKSMRRLNLLGATADDSAMDILSGMPRLQVLNLYRTRITNSGVAKLESLKQLTDVDLRYTLVTSNGIDALHAAVPAARIQAVLASAPKKLGAGAAHPADSSPAAIAAWVKAIGGKSELSGNAITAIDLSSTPVSDAQLESLTGLASIEKLNLSVTQVSDLGLSSIAKMTGLKELNLNSTTVSDNGVAKLATLSKLENLHLGVTLVKGPGLDGL